jgi:hypothetical protein
MSALTLIRTLLLCFFMPWVLCQTGHDTSGVQWFASRDAVVMMNDINATLTEYFFNQSNAFTSFSLNLSFTASQRVASFTSISSFASALSSMNFFNVEWVIYDIENWSFTPLSEQLDPAGAMANFSQLAHENNLKAICTPAMDLVNVLNCSGSQTWQKFLNCNIPAAAASVCDIFEIQAQGFINNASLFQEVVSECSLQALSVNANITIWAGLSTGPSGQNTTATALFNGFINTRNIVQGYWLNIPGNSSYCPKCTTPQPQLAIDFLTMVLLYTTNNQAPTPTSNPTPTYPGTTIAPVATSPLTLPVSPASPASLTPSKSVSSTITNSPEKQLSLAAFLTLVLLFM